MQIKHKAAENIFLVMFSVFGIFYSLEFGLLLTAYPHGGQLVGVIFAVVLIFYSCVIIFSKSKEIRQIFRIINYTYILSMILYVLTIKVIEYVKGKASWQYLNVFNPPQLSRNEKIFNAYAISGLIICLTLILIWCIRGVRRKKSRGHSKGA